MIATRSILFVLAMLAFTAPLAQGRKMLAERDWGDKKSYGDGTEVLSRARVFEGKKPANTRAVTAEAAEATANPNFAAIWRRAMPADAKLSFATVEGVQGTNEDRAKKTVMPRARSAVDVPTGPRPDMISGNAMVPLVAMGGAALAQTYEGALSAATSDSITVGNKNAPGGKPTNHANSMITSYAKWVPKASKAASYGTTAQNAGSAAMAGAADGTLVVAQAHEVAAIAQAASSGPDQWHHAALRKEIGNASH